MSKPVELTRDGAWLTLWLNRPKARNAMSSDMIATLIDALRNAATDASIRGITLRGRGGVFCAGGDLKQFKSALQGTASYDDAVAANLHAAELFDLVAGFPKVVVALIEGAAMAGGLGLACAADIVVVTRAARFALTETALGIPPAQIAAHVVRRIGATRAKRLMLTGARFEGVEAQTLGIADFVVDQATDLDATERQLRNDILRCAPGANAVTKALIGALATLDQKDIVQRAAHDFATCLLGDEGREGVAAFVDKRTAAWASGVKDE